MSRDDVHHLMRTLMDEYDPHHWTARVGRGVKQFGSCDYSRRTITVSGALAALNSRDEVRDTILHEIAHALVGPHVVAHGREWKAVCAAVGGRPEAQGKYVTVAAPWVRVCPSCGSERGVRAHRRSRGVFACGPCCQEFNGGEFSGEFALDWVRVEAFENRSA